MNKQKYVVFCLFDIRKCFDSLNYQFMISKLLVIAPMDVYNGNDSMCGWQRGAVRLRQHHLYHLVFGYVCVYSEVGEEGYVVFVLSR